MSQGLNVVILFLLKISLSVSFFVSWFYTIVLKIRLNTTTINDLATTTTNVKDRKDRKKKVEGTAGAATPKEAIFQYYIYTVTQYKYKIYIAVLIIHKIMIETM